MPIRNPGLPGAVMRESPEARFVPGEGWHRPMDLILAPEQFEQYRTGYRCPRCHSVQSQAFPEECETVWRDTGEKCGFRIKDDLHKWLEFEFRGEETLWPDREDAINDDREREDWTPATGIWLPGDDT